MEEAREAKCFFSRHIPLSHRGHGFVMFTEVFTRSGRCCVESGLRKNRLQGLGEVESELRLRSSDSFSPSASPELMHLSREGSAGPK